MLGNIGRGTAIFAAQHQALQQPQRDQNNRGDKPDLIGGRQDAHDEGGGAHDHDGDEERIFSSHHVAQTAEQQGAEGPHQKPGGEGEQGEDIARALWILAEELGANNRGERAVKVKIVLFEHRAERGGNDDLVFFGGHGPIRRV